MHADADVCLFGRESSHNRSRGAIHDDEPGHELRRPQGYSQGNETSADGLRVPKRASIPIGRVRRKRPRLPSSLLIENASASRHTSSLRP